MAWRTFDKAIAVEVVGAYNLLAERAELRRTGAVEAEVQLWNGTAVHTDTLDLAKADERRRYARDAEEKEAGLGKPVGTALHRLLIDLRKILRTAAAAPPGEATGAGRDAGQGVYGEEHGRTVWHRPTRDGVVPTPLANFTARIGGQVVADDGAEERASYEIAGALHDGTPLGTARVPVSQFAAMNWVPVFWPYAIVSAGMGAKDRLREAVQERSGRYPIRHVYEHTGWRMIDGQPVFLSAGGGIGAGGVVDGVEVELTGTLARIALPPPPDGDRLVEVVRASLALMKVAPPRVTTVTTAATHLPPLRELLRDDPPDLTLWPHGPSGVGKSELAALAQAHYGAAFTRLTLSTFRATANALERLMFSAKDCLLVVDDYHPAQDRREAEEMARVAGRLLRGAGNGAGRPRMQADTRLRPDLPPRCVPLATAERLPEGHSSASRAFFVAVEPGDVDWTLLAAAQERRALLPEATAGYVRWIAAHWGELAAALPARFKELRAKALGLGTHAREPSQVAHLCLGLETWLRFAEEVGAVDAEEAGARCEEAWTVLAGLATAQGQMLAEETPVARFLALLGDGFAGRTAYLADLENGGEPADPPTWGWEPHAWTDKDGEEHDGWRHPNNAAFLGYADGDWLYLLPQATEQFVAKAARAADRRFPVELRTLTKRLDEAGLLAVDPDGVHRTARVRPGAGGEQVAVLLAACLEQTSLCCTRPEHRAVERALTRVWLSPTPAHADAYLAVLAPVLRESLRRERAAARASSAPPALPALVLPYAIGPYEAEGLLGSGGDGIAVRARHRGTGAVVTLKLPARGDTGVFDRLGGERHPAVLRSLELIDVGENAHALVREPADGTLADALRERRGRPSPRAEALAIFAACCEAVAWLHDRRIYRWSAHPANVFRVGAAWKIGDFGRCVVFVPREHPVLVACRRAALDAAGRHDADAEAVADFVHAHAHWGLPTAAGVFEHDPDRERRHRLDDCSMLGGLLCDVLTGRRWGAFVRAFGARPLCSSTYALTGRLGVDAGLSAVLNRCWRGDAGGAPLLANRGRGAQTAYEDARELLADVAAALGLPLPAEGSSEESVG